MVKTWRSLLQYLPVIIVLMMGAVALGYGIGAKLLTTTPNPQVTTTTTISITTTASVTTTSTVTSPPVTATTTNTVTTTTTATPPVVTTTEFNTTTSTYHEVIILTTTSTLTTTTEVPAVIPPVDFSKLKPINSSSISQEDLLRLYRDYLNETACSSDRWVFLNPVAPTPSIETFGEMFDSKGQNYSLPQNILPIAGCSKITFAYYEDVSTYRADWRDRFVIAGGTYVTLSTPLVYSDGKVRITVSNLSGPMADSGCWLNMTRTAAGSWRTNGGYCWIA